LDKTDALALLANRYLAGHAPASAEDLAKWAGITLANARLGLATTNQNDLAGGRLPSPRLLGSFDPLMHGWVSRAPFVDADRGVVTTNGIFRPVALVGGRVVATWSLPDGVVTIAPLGPIPEADLARLAADGADVLRYLALPDRPVVVRPTSGVPSY
jgi:hypothetical protein